MAPAPTLGPILIPAGAYWCSLYPTSRSVDDLVEPFRTHVRDFIAALTTRGCTVEITATLRPEPRAWLMYWVWRLVHGLVGIDAIPVRPDIPIEWTHAGALEMLHAYELVVEPAPPPDPEKPGSGSRHLYGLAIDMEIGNWMASDDELYALGAEFGVIKLRKDPPHWSIDGH